MTKLITLKIDDKIKPLNELSSFLSPEYVYIPSDNNKVVGDYVYKDEQINNYFSSISGYIKNITKKVIDDKNCNVLEIENDFKENRQKRVSLNKKLNSYSKDKLCEELKQKNFLSVYDKIAQYKHEYLIINAVDEDPYVFNELIRLTTLTDEMLYFIDVLCNILRINKCIIVTNNTNEHSITNLERIIGMYPKIRLVLAPNKYLISQRKYLCKFLRVPEADSLIITSKEIYEMNEVLKKNKQITSQIITVSGTAVKNSQVINVKMFCQLREVLKEVKYETSANIYINGFMKGVEIGNIDDIIITPNINAVIINKKGNDQTIECINCGACNKICPENINVKRCLDRKVASAKCINCGLCNYICPAKINIKKYLVGDIHE